MRIDTARILPDWLLVPWRTLVVAGLVVVLPILAAGEISAAQTLQQSREEQLTRARLVTTQAADIVSQRLIRLRNQLTVSYSAPGLSDLAQAGDSPALRVELTSFRNLMGEDVSRLYVLGSNGVVAVAPPEAIAGRTFLSSSYVDRSVTDTAARVSSVFYASSDNSHPALVIQVWSQRPGQQPAGVWLVAEVELGRAREWLRPLVTSADEFYLIDAGDQLVLSTTRPGLGAIDLHGKLPVAQTDASVRPDPVSGRSRLIATAPVAELGWQVAGLWPSIELPPDVEAALAQARLLRLVLGAIVLGGTFALARSASAIASQRRSLATANERLERVNRELESTNLALAEATAAKSRFLANMSHELRTPLNAIIGFSDVLLQGLFGELNPKQHEYVDDIRESGGHQLALVNDILDLSKVEAGKMELHPQDFDLPDLLRSVHSIISPLAQAKHLALELRLDQQPGLVHHDPARLKQVLLNLLSNAVKFTREGGAVTTMTAILPTDRFSVSVRDTGVGIRAEDQAAIFEEFKQIPGESDAPGTGLGLALAKRFVEAMGGGLSLSSTLGAGSTFTIDLPIRQPAEGPPHPAQHAAPDAAQQAEEPVSR